ncbi:hypothetical protein PROFUN_15528 [Planoprotostelium fungivorum]|uniref:Uncharacterized protein n=1 Tax=Planoprotostelium fungivorum TaxID=1890364 RepID=A0A2P6MUQ8_9EUKA|nr:hypothetical protein PROFUN_15528 [Planoprotostelium fungivorum]
MVTITCYLYAKTAAPGLVHPPTTPNRCTIGTEYLFLGHHDQPMDNQKSASSCRLKSNSPSIVRNVDLYYDGLDLGNLRFQGNSTLLTDRWAFITEQYVALDPVILVLARTFGAIAITPSTISSSGLHFNNSVPLTGLSGLLNTAISPLYLPTNSNDGVLHVINQPVFTLETVSLTGTANAVIQTTIGSIELKDIPLSYDVTLPGNNGFQNPILYHFSLLDSNATNVNFVVVVTITPNFFVQLFHIALQRGQTDRLNLTSKLITRYLGTEDTPVTA